MTFHNSLAALSLITASLFSSSALAATVYVPGGSAGAIFVFDGETGELKDRWEGFDAIHGLGGAPGAKYIVAGSFSEIEQSELTTLQKPADMSEDDHEAHHTKSEKSLIEDQVMISLLSVIDPKNGQIIRRIEVPGAVHHVAVSPDGRFAVATHPSGDAISVVDLETLQLRSTIATGTMPNYAVFGQDPAIVYVSNTGNGTVSEVDLNKNIVLRNFVAGDGPEHIVIDSTGDRLFVADADAGFVTELPFKLGAPARRFDIGGQIHGLDLSGDKTKLFVAAKETDRMSMVDLDSGNISYEPLDPAPYHLTVIGQTPNLFVSSREESKLWVLRQDDLTKVAEVQIEGEGHQMVVLP